MKGIYKLITTMCLVVSLISIPCVSAAAGYGTAKEEASTEAMIGDAVVVRPFGFVSVILGAAFFVVSLPFSALGGNTGEAAEKMVVEPVKFTFKRPLGKF